MKTMTKLSAILLAVATCAIWPAAAQDAASPTPAPPLATNTNVPSRPRPNPRYTGIIESIDTNNMVLTLKVANRQSKVKITSATRITKDRQPATFADALVGMRVNGSGKKSDDGTWTATTMNILTRPRTPPPAATPNQKTE